MSTARQVGTVEILRLRVYPFNPNDPLGFDHTGADVVVQPGTYPLYERDGCYHWVMSGTVSGGGFRRLGEGLFMFGPDETDGPTVQHMSKQFDAAEWADLLADPTCTEGHPDQRLRIRLAQDVLQ